MLWPDGICRTWVVWNFIWSCNCLLKFPCSTPSYLWLCREPVSKGEATLASISTSRHHAVLTMSKRYRQSPNRLHWRQGIKGFSPPTWVLSMTLKLSATAWHRTLDSCFPWSPFVPLPWPVQFFIIFLFLSLLKSGIWAGSMASTFGVPWYHYIELGVPEGGQPEPCNTRSAQKLIAIEDHNQRRHQEKHDPPDLTRTHLHQGQSRTLYTTVYLTQGIDHNLELPEYPYAKHAKGGNVQQTTNHFRAVRQAKPPIPNKNWSKLPRFVNPLPEKFQPTNVAHLAVQRGGWPLKCLKPLDQPSQETWMETTIDRGPSLRAPFNLRNPEIKVLVDWIRGRSFNLHRLPSQTQMKVLNNLFPFHPLRVRLMHRRKESTCTKARFRKPWAASSAHWLPLAKNLATPSHLLGSTCAGIQWM